MMEEIKIMFNFIQIGKKIDRDLYRSLNLSYSAKHCNLGRYVSV